MKIAALLTVALMVVGLQAASAQTPAVMSPSKVPVRQLTAIVGPENVETFVVKFREIAMSDGFAIRVGHPSPTATTIQLRKDDLEVVAVNTRDAGTFSVFLYSGADKEHV